jgi:predicted N-acetyltransferase YhbS
MTRQHSGLLIRQFEMIDLPAALAIQSETYPAYLVESSEAFASRLSLPASYCLAAVRGETLVAYLLAHGWGREAPPPVGVVLLPQLASEVLFIHDLAVSPGERGSGVGRPLVMRAFELAARDGVSMAELIAVHGAASYWHTLGFIEAEVPDEISARVAAYGPEARWMKCDIPTTPGGRNAGNAPAW